jgi:hypothetical protein
LTIIYRVKLRDYVFHHLHECISRNELMISYRSS